MTKNIILTAEQRKRFYEDHKDGGLAKMSLSEMEDTMEKYSRDEDLSETRGFISRSSELEISKKVLKNLMSDLFDRGEHFDFVNNVLSSKAFGEDVKGIWLWFGNLRLAMHGDTTAGEMAIIDGYDFAEDGSVNFHINPHLGVR